MMVWNGADAAVLWEYGATLRTSIGVDASGTAAGLVSSHESTYNHTNFGTAYSHSQLTSGNPHVVTPAELSLVIGTDVQAQGAVLDDLNILGAAASDGQFLVATGAGVFAYESGDTARISLGVGTTDSPQLAGLTVTGDIVTTETIDAHTGKVLVTDNDVVEPYGESDGYVGVAIIDGTARVYFAVDGDMYYIDGTIVAAAAEIVTGNPIGLLLALTYNLE